MEHARKDPTEARYVGSPMMQQVLNHYSDTHAHKYVDADAPASSYRPLPPTHTPSHSVGHAWVD
eukprot:16730-Eustigmatos_ZCMA.PRE.1